MSMKPEDKKIRKAFAGMVDLFFTNVDLLRSIADQQIQRLRDGEPIEEIRMDWLNGPFNEIPTMNEHVQFVCKTISEAKHFDDATKSAFAKEVTDEYEKAMAPLKKLDDFLMGRVPQSEFEKYVPN